MPSNPWLLIAALLGGLAVACGAFGAHGLKLDAHQLANWDTAARYHMYHALAMLAIGLLAARSPSRALHLAGIAMTIGTLVFSGCLYTLVLTGQRWLGAIVPIGGVLLIVGWLLLAVAVFQRTNP